MMKKLLFCICLFIGIGSFSYAYEKEKIIPIPIFEIEDAALLEILDQAISHEKTLCNYYSSDLVFSISTYKDKEEDIWYVRIESRGIIYYLNDKDTIAPGCFKYKNHLFLVRVANEEHPIFRKTTEKMDVLCENADQYDPVTGEQYLTIFEDDSFSFWTYEYTKGNFLLIQSFTWCDKLEEFKKLQ